MQACLDSRLPRDIATASAQWEKKTDRVGDSDEPLLLLLVLHGTIHTVPRHEVRLEVTLVKTIHFQKLAKCM